MSDPTTPSRSRLLGVLALIWVMLISAVAIVDRVAVGHLTQRVAEDIEYDQRVLQSFEERLTALEHRVEAMQGAPSKVSEQAFIKAQQAIDRRLDQIDRLAREAVPASDISLLLKRLSALENRLTRVSTSVRHAPPTRAPEAVHAERPPLDPPFTVLGIEWRGSQRFLSLAPAGAYSLDAVRVLQPGEAYADWQLESMDGEGAIFRVADRARRITVP